MKKTVLKLMTGVFGTVILMSACKKDNDTQTEPPVTPGKDRSKYVFVYSGKGAAGNAGTYIVTANDISQGEISATGNGVEVEAYSFIVTNNTLFAQAYTNQGPVTPFRLNEEGKIVEAGRLINTFRTGVYGTVNNNAWVGGGDPRQSGLGELFLYDAVKLQVTAKSSIDLKAITGTGENAVWTGLFQVDNKLYVPYYKFKPVEGGAPWMGKYGSLDSTWIAVLSYPELKYEKTIADGRSGFVGNWFGMQGLHQVENGDVYTWSTAGEINDIKSKNHSGVLRIKKGTTEFDQSYFFDMEKRVGVKIARAEYISKGKFLMSLYAGATTGDVSGGRVRLAIVDVFNQTVNYVQGAPEHAQPDFKMQVYNERDGKTINYVMEEDGGEFYVYVIDAETATAKRGLHIKGAEGVTSISKLTY
ncbi:DUF4374 domain-containing protein [Chitinophaga nivalis]|uniref:DUF4374 domain-containing protein n=1 Tax=Chitinophaga nivalis TaxID=2991709 RepID=A0ABT3ILZ7_9BACT|nr:DUF4374 domain-containing protein [Chitinophaga nivalis]MCW3465310.1 DUF4374 domain-containing protein [Chitinophaga nivalis]MCW3484998.1 DUF4374 domain-containing protein [Chitinophaga nivalis]